MSPDKRSLRPIFGRNVANTRRVNAFVTEVTLRNLQDIMPILEPHRERFCDDEQMTLEKQRDSLYTTVSRSGLIVLKNAKILETDDANLTDGITTAAGSASYKLSQDLPHRDAFCPDELNPKVSVLHTHFDDQRNTPIQYAMASSVKRAIEIISKGNVSNNVREALCIMAQPNYTFTLGIPEKEQRKALVGYEELTAELYDLIPDDEKYAHTWEKNDNTILLHGNAWSKPAYGPADGLLHFRPASNDIQTVMSKRICCP